jgi:outer membrane murein-binding lipoprotein Lpp
MDPETLKLVGVILGALLTGGLLKAVLDYRTAKKTTQIDYSSSVAQTLAELNDRLKSDLKEVREELRVERAQRRTLEEQVIEQREELREERRLRRELEERVHLLESGDTKP